LALGILLSGGAGLALDLFVLLRALRAVGHAGLALGRTLSLLLCLGASLTLSLLFGLHLGLALGLLLGAGAGLTLSSLIGLHLGLALSILLGLHLHLALGLFTRFAALLAVDLAGGTIVAAARLRGFGLRHRGAAADAQPDPARDPKLLPRVPPRTVARCDTIPR